MRFNNALDDDQTEPGSLFLGFCGCGKLLKFIEKLGNLPGWNSRSGIGYAKHHALALAKYTFGKYWPGQLSRRSLNAQITSLAADKRRNSNFAAASGKFQRVTDEIVENLGDFVFIKRKFHRYRVVQF